MAQLAKFLSSTAGVASGGGGGSLDVDDVFSTYLYEGNGSVQMIENGIQLGAASTDNVALHMTGATSTDNGPLSLTVNSIGNATTSTTQTKFTSKSLYVDGTGSGASTTCFDIQEGQIKLAKKDFTIEYWVYYNSHNSYGDLGSGNYYVSGYDGNFRMGIGGSGTNINIFAYDAQTFLGSVSGTVSVSTGTWYHVAISRSNGTAYLFLDGTLVTSGAFDHDLTDAEIGGITLGKIDIYEQVDAYFSDFRITVGAARYTSSFTAPSAALPVDSGTSGEGGLVWIKNRDVANSNQLFDTERGALYRLNSDTTNAASNSASGALTAFNSNGFTVGDWGPVNNSGSDLVSWTFRKAPKFFDVVTYTGNFTAGRTISHNLGSVPGLIIIKKTSTTSNWFVYHRSLGEGKFIKLNESDPETSNTFVFDNTAPTSTEFTIGESTNTNANGVTYVAYLFAHNNGDGEFGPDADQDIIKCGSISHTNGSDTTVDLGFEPQWLMVKCSSTSGNWFMVDNMRGITTGGNDARLYADSSSAESYANSFDLTSSGFILKSGFDTHTYIYMAIRRGPLAEPESASDVFAIATRGAVSGEPGFRSDTGVVDMALVKTVNTSSDWGIKSRLTQGTNLATNSTAAEGSLSYAKFDYMNGHSAFDGTNSNTYSWMWRRAPSYFDCVCYSGTGSARTVNHNLTVPPEMIWVKRRDTAGFYWMVYHKGVNGGTNPEQYYMLLNATNAQTDDDMWNDTAPTSSVFTVKDNSNVNNSSGTYIAYLFATVAGVSKVGSFTGTGSDINIDCGFSSGARFILCKRTDSTSPWWVFDTVRGIVAGNDAILELNSTNAEYTSYDFIDPLSSGFTVTGSFSNWNANGGSYIFYAIA